VSFRTRLFITYALIVFICLGMVAILMTVLLQGYRDRLTMERLDNMARPISVQVRSLIGGQVTARDLWSSLQEQAENNNVFILLGDGNGNIVRQIAPVPSSNQEQIQVSSGFPRNLIGPTQGKFQAVDGTTYLFAAYPVARVASSVAAKVDTLALAIPQAESMAIMASLFRPLLLAGMIALIISLILAFFFARSVYRPLKQVTGAAQRISQGDYDKKIPVKGPREFRDLAANFNDMAEKVKQSQLQLRHFVADVSHELKSPITSIRGFAQALIDGTANDDDKRLKAARIINDESARMRRQVDELLELARMQSGQIRIANERLDIHELLDHCVDVFSLQAQEKGVVLKATHGNKVHVLGDFDRLEELIGNLLDNAIKNTPSEGEVQISDTINDEYIEIRISDSGPGIPQEQLPYVFERFYQVTGVRTGVGLGLAIAREIALAHNGTITAESQPGEGATFIVRLPSADLPIFSKDDIHQ
jgi:signal transduction histidine kinase